MVVIYLQNKKRHGKIQVIIKPNFFSNKSSAIVLNYGTFFLQNSTSPVTISTNPDGTWKTAEDTQKKILTIDKNSLLYSFPLQEMLAAPGLYDQNPGYD